MQPAPRPAGKPWRFEFFEQALPGETSVDVLLRRQADRQLGGGLSKSIDAPPRSLFPSHRQARCAHVDPRLAAWPALAAVAAVLRASAKRILKLIAAIFAADAVSPYPRGVKVLEKNRIAVWDVLEAAERPGSLDSSIVHASALANDFAKFYRAHPRIGRVFFNGRKAEQMYRRFVLTGLGEEFSYIRYAGLPSTSPAHAGMTFAKKLDRWSRIKESER